MPQETSRTGFSYTQFGGLVTNSDPRDIQSGAVRMENVTPVTLGQISSRKGHAAVTFLNDQESEEVQILALYRHETPVRKYVIYQGSDGTIRAGRDASL